MKYYPLLFLSFSEIENGFSGSFGHIYGIFGERLFFFPKCTPPPLWEFFFLRFFFWENVHGLLPPFPLSAYPGVLVTPRFRPHVLGCAHPHFNRYSCIDIFLSICPCIKDTCLFLYLCIHVPLYTCIVVFMYLCIQLTNCIQWYMDSEEQNTLVR